MSTTLHIDGKVYASPQEAASRTGMSEGEIRDRIASGKVRSVTVGKKVYVDVLQLQQLSTSQKVDTPKESARETPRSEQKSVAPVPVPNAPGSRTLPVLQRSPERLRTHAKRRRFRIPVLAVLVLVVGFGLIGATYFAPLIPTSVSYESSEARAAASDAPIAEQLVAYFQELLGLTPAPEGTFGALDWPEIQEKQLPPARPPSFATSSQVTYVLPPAPPPVVEREGRASTPTTIVERVIERVGGGVTQAGLDAQLAALSSALASRISSSNSATQNAYVYTNQVWNEGLANALRIDMLDDVEIIGADISNLEVTGTATTTFESGINISSGCFAVDGTCITGSGGGGSSLFTDGGSSTYLTSVTDNLAIGTSTAYARLSVWGAGTGTDALFELANSASTTIAKFLDNGTGYFLGNIGIGTTTPYAKLSLTDAVSTAQAVLAYDGTRYTEFLTNSVGDLVINPQGGDVFLNDENLLVCTGGSCPSGNPTGTGNIVAENKLGIGTTTPDSKISIETQDGTTDFLRIASSTAQSLLVFDERGYLGIGTSTPTEQLSISNKLFVGNGTPASSGTATSTFLGDVLITGKLDVSTIDPIYTIDGVKYATYGHSTIGIKEEMTAKVTPTTFDKEKDMYVYAIDFRRAPLGSDAWLFYHVTYFGNEWERLVAVLSPSFDGRAFYEEDIEHARVLVYAEKPLPVSVRLIADRFDAREWPNVRPDQHGFPGLTPPPRE